MECIILLINTSTLPPTSRHAIVLKILFPRFILVEDQFFPKLGLPFSLCKMMTATNVFIADLIFSNSL